MKTNSKWVICIVTSIFTSILGCSSKDLKRTNTNIEMHQPIESGPGEFNSCALWELPLNAHLSHLSTIPNGSRILISTSGESQKTKKGLLQASIRMANHNGKTLWKVGLAQPVKSQSLAEDGSLLAVNTYDNKLQLFNDHGKKLWEREHLGNPIVLKKKNRIVLINDDDAEPKTAFVVYNLEGKKTAQVSLSEEPIDMVVSEDYLVTSTASNNLMVFDLDGQIKWQGRLPNDSIAISITFVDATPVFIVLTKSKKNSSSQLLTAYIPDSGKNLGEKWSIELGRKYESIKASKGKVLLYGNSHLGQSVAIADIKSAKIIWSRSYNIAATYSSLTFAGSFNQGVYGTFALEEAEPAGVLHILGVNLSDQNEGKVIWNTPIQAESGIYSFTFANEKTKLYVGSGEPESGIVKAYSIQKNDCEER